MCKNSTTIGPHHTTYSDLSDATFAILKTIDKTEFRVLIKYCFLMGFDGAESG